MSGKLVIFMAVLTLGQTQSPGGFIFPDQFATLNPAGPYYQAPVEYSGFSQSQAPVDLTDGFGIQHSYRTTTASPTPAAVEAASTTANPLRIWTDHVNDVISSGVLKFGLEVEKEIARAAGPSATRGNIIFSPISLSMTMAMVLLGSAGRTFDEVATLLGLQTGIDISTRSEIVHQIFGVQLQQVHKRIFGSTGPRVDFASAVFVQNGYPIRPEFAKVSQEVYQSQVINVDFLRNSLAAANTVNRWVNEKTNGKITSILESPPDPMTSMILASALYFNGEWNQHFIRMATKRKPFFIEPDKKVEVDTMYNGGTFPYYYDKQLGVKILGLPYKGREIWMYVMLPDVEGATALRQFSDSLKPETIENLINNMQNTTCILSMPRMKISNSLSLANSLQNLGLHSLFTPSADLSLISPGKRANVNVKSPNGNNGVVFVSQRFGEDNGPTDGTKRNFFSYEDKSTGLLVEQWSTGFSIGKNRFRGRRSPQEEISKDSYTVEESEESKEETIPEAKVVNLEENKYRFEGLTNKRRRRRQTRPINQDFLQYIDSLGFPKYGIDDLRNSGTLTNPGLFATDVRHKVEMEITEKGTEAAAATSVALERDGSQKRVVLDRPFLFFIRHNPTRLMLFWGTLNIPTPFYVS